MIGNIFVQSWLIWATFDTTGEHCFHQKLPFLSFDLKNIFTKDFPMQPFANGLQIRCYCKFPDNHKKYLFWNLFLIHVLIKLQDWWPAALLKKTLTQVFSFEYLKVFEKKSFVASSEKDFEGFLRISKSGLTWSNLYDLTNLNL